MDGSRRYSKIYCKTQAGAEALTAGRGALSSSARQLLILLDGERDFDELSRIFGEDTLYRLLPFLESQGFVEPFTEAATAQDEPPTSPTTTRLGISTALPTTVLTPEATVTQVAAPPPATLSEPLPVQAPAKSPRFLAVPIAILVSLATAAVTVNWVFEREQHAAESPQQVQETTPPAVSAGNASKQPLVGAGSVAPSSEVRTAQNVSSPGNSEPTHPPLSALGVPAPAGRSSSSETSAPARDTTWPLALQGKTTLQPVSSASKTAASETTAQSNDTDSRPAQRGKVASDLTLEASMPSVPSTKTQIDETAARVAAKPKVATKSPSADAKEAQTGPDTSLAKGQGTLALVAPDRGAAQSPAPAPATVGLHVRSRVLPAISKRALESGIYGGKAVVRLHVTSAGTVERVELLSADPPEVYGPDVQHALEQWTFEPPSNPAQFTLDLDFRQQPPQPSSNEGKATETSQSATSSQ